MSTTTNRSVVVTGAYGYVGVALSARLRAEGFTVRRATRRSRHDPEAWVGELSDVEYVRRLVDGAHAIFHLAAQTSVKAAQADPLADLIANAGATLTLLQACRTSIPFIYAGTATEAGLSAGCDAPITVYDANKLAGEHLVGVYTDMGLVRGVTLRITNLYGPGGEQKREDRGVLNRMLARAMSGGGLTYFGDGLALRDYVYIDDVVEAFVRAAEVIPTFAPGYSRTRFRALTRRVARSYVLGSGVSHSLREAFEIVADVAADFRGPRVRVSSAPWPMSASAIDKRSVVADVGPLEEFLGWRPEVTMRDGLRRTARALIGA